MRTSRILARGVAGVFLVIQGCALPPPGSAPADGAAQPPASSPLGGPLAGALPGSTPAQPAGPAGPTTPPTGATDSFPELDAWPGGKLPPAEFFRMIAPAVIASSKQTGVPAAVTMAQAALETGYGGSTIATAKNLFGIKGEGPAGSISAPTTESINGSTVRITDRFRKYNTWLESIVDHDKLLSTKARYAGAMAVKDDPERFARAIHEAGYATDPEYSNKLIRIMRDNNLIGLTSA